MRDLEHRRYIEGVVCPHVPLRVFSKRERSRMEKQGLIFLKAKLQKCPHVPLRVFSKRERSRMGKDSPIILKVQLQKSGIFEISQKI